MKYVIFIFALAGLQASAGPTPERSDKVFCMFLVPEPRQNVNFVNATYATWGKQCNHTIVAGLNIKEDKNLNFTIWSLKKAPGKGGNVEALNRIFDNFQKDFEKKTYGWILVTLDSTFVIMKNLRDFVKQQDFQKLLYFGNDQGYNKTFDAKNYNYMSIEAGYVISWPALKKLSEVVKDTTTVNPNCTFTTNEYVQIGKCMKNITAETVNTHYIKDKVEYSKFWNVSLDTALKNSALKVGDHNVSSISFALNSTVEMLKVAKDLASFGTMLKPSLSFSLMFTAIVAFFTRMFY